MYAIRNSKILSTILNELFDNRKERESKGQERTGQDRTGKDRKGQEKTGQEMK
jgi:hypothetical protein